MHEITLLQGLSLAALVFVLGIDFWLEALFLFRPIIVCTLTGAILGDIQTGLITGGLTELAFAGLTPAGGVQPPNPIMAGAQKRRIRQHFPDLTGQRCSSSLQRMR